MLLLNPNEGENWKLFIWDDHIKVQGNDNKFMVQPVLSPAAGLYKLRFRFFLHMLERSYAPGA